MATTPNYGWPTPDNTDLVKDGAEAIRDLGDNVDTSLADLLGGTTGQVLTKTSDTDLDFSFTTPAASPLTTKGDLYTFSTVDARLPVGTDGHTLVADSVEATGLKWVTPASGLTLISATPCSAVASQAVTGFSATSQNYRIIIAGDGTAGGVVHLKLRSSSTDSSTAYFFFAQRFFSSNTTQTSAGANGTAGFEVCQAFTASSGVIDIIRPFDAVRTSVFSTGIQFDTGNTRSVSVYNAGVHNAQTSFDGFNVIWGAGAFTGTIYLYGYQKA